MTQRKRLICGIILKSALLLIGLFGQLEGLISGGFMHEAHFLYFTNLSNIWIMLICAVFLGYDLRRLAAPDAPSAGKTLYGIKFMFTSAILLTFTVFSLLLTPEMIIKGNYGYLFSAGNLCVHNIVPALAVADWFVSDTEKSRASNKPFFLLGGIMPIAYCCFALIGSALGVTFGGGAKVPYFFFDYEKSGWLSAGGGRLGVVWWIILLSAAQLGMSALLAALKNRIIKKEEAAAAAQSAKAEDKAGII